MKNFDQFHETLNRYSVDNPLSRSESGDAFHNLTGFMSLLIQVNEREKVVSYTKEKDGAGL
tara:strand:+ start:310 stop:492 length:183 start_codon:yes stop_codon:yes gene_type:complete